MKLTDGKFVVDIRMVVWQGTSYSPDWSNDFFEAGSLPFDEECEAYVVEDVDYCIDQAQEWGAEEENNMVFVDEIKSPNRVWTVSIKDREDSDMDIWTTSFSAEEKADAFKAAVEEKLKAYGAFEKVDVIKDSGSLDDTGYLSWIDTR